MPRRRRILIGFASLVLGSSGILAAGAFRTGPGSEGGEWIQVDTVAAEEDEDAADGDGDDTQGERRLEFIADPNEALTTGSGYIRQRGGLIEINIEQGINTNAMTRIGQVGSNGYPSPNHLVAFVARNHGGPLSVTIEPNGSNPEFRFPSYVNRVGQSNETVDLHAEEVPLQRGDEILIVVEIDTSGMSSRSAVDVDRLTFRTGPV